MTLAVLTPFHGSPAVELGNRMWRKRVLPVGDVDYKGRTLHFTIDYLKRLASAFTDRAYDQVAFQLADAQNTHTNDPERFRGEIVAMDAEADGLWLTMRPTDAGDQVLRDNPNLGVSARIVEDYARSDGRHFPAAIQHVLGTLDPRIPGLGPWQAIEASNPVPDQVLDLSASHFAGDDEPASPPQSQPTGGTGMDGMNLTDEQRAKFARLLDLPDETLDALAAGGAVVSPGDLGLDGEDSELSDAELDELIAAAEELDAAGLLDDEDGAEGGGAAEYVPQPQPEPVAAGLSAEAQFAIDLANAKAEETARELSVVTARLREEDYQAEKRRLADLGVPPYIVEMARPLLEGAGHAVELANGKTVDAGSIMRRVLGEYASQVKLLDLDVELGSPMDEPEGAAEEGIIEARRETVNRFKSVTGLK